MHVVSCACDPQKLLIDIHTHTRNNGLIVCRVDGGHTIDTVCTFYSHGLKFPYWLHICLSSCNATLCIVNIYEVTCVKTLVGEVKGGGFVFIATNLWKVKCH